VEKTIVEDALGFLPQWKEPCIILYRDDDHPGELWRYPVPTNGYVVMERILFVRIAFCLSRLPEDAMNEVLERLLGNEVTMAATVFNAPSISPQGPDMIRSFTPLPLSQLPVRQ